MTVFTLSGTPAQQALVQSALDACDFPFGRLVEKLQATKGRTTIPVEWADLSTYGTRVAEAKATSGHAHIHEDGDTGHPIEYRERVLGLFWFSGRIQIDNSLESDPRLAQEVFLSEAAHAVDIFLLEPADRRAIWEAMHAGQAETAEHQQAHGWFETPFSQWTGEAE